ncbi:ATP-binding protein [Streptomyces sp. CB01881]|uniref:ATP-binding protein n=1 Tax=Streptomyces sp. CB01881 TaxID=2078691 RepID=UPI001386F449|nr:ATP-binding protein [Streptomyces sp. CB01881]
MTGARLSPTNKPSRGGGAPTWARRLPLSRRPGAVGEARAFTAAVLADVPDPMVVADAVLLVSELVTNACRHADGPESLLLARGPRVLRIEVTDGNPHPPRPRPLYRADETGGFGLFLLSNVAFSWGWRPRSAGKAVWCELRLPERRTDRPPRQPSTVGRPPR